MALTRRSAIALLFVMALGAFLRLHGIGFLLPGQTEPDAVVYSAQVKSFQEGEVGDETKKLFAFYPHFVSRLAVGVMPPRSYATPAKDLAEHVYRAAEPRRRIRITVALLSLFAIPSVWLLARRIADPPFALASAVFMAASFLTLWFAQQARPHAASSAFAAMAVAAAVHLRSSGGWRAYACAGLAAGLAISSLQSGLAVLPALALAVLLRARAREDRFATVAFGSLAMIAIIAVQIVIFYPFVFTPGQPGEIARQESMLNVSGHLIDLKLFNGEGFGIVARSAWLFDPVICSLAILGVVIGIGELWSRRGSMTRTSRDQVWIVLAFAVPYTIVIGLYARTYQRFVLPLTPIQCVLAGYALCRIVCFAARFGCLTRRCAGALAVVLVAFQVFGAWRLSEARSQPSTIDEAARWIEGHVPRDARIALLPMMELPLQFTPAAFKASSPTLDDVSFMWFRYLRALDAGAFTGTLWNIHAMVLTTPEMRDEARTDPVAFLRGTEAEYAVIPLVGEPRRVVPRAIRDGAASLGRRVARFSPDTDDTGGFMDFAYQDDGFEHTSFWFGRGLNVRCTGPVVEIYKLR
jgi:hypothetical protein